MVLRHYFIFLLTGIAFSLIFILGSWVNSDVGPDKFLIKKAGKIWGRDLSLQSIPIPGDLMNREELVKNGDKVYLVSKPEGGRGYILLTYAKGRYEYFDYAVFYSDHLAVHEVIVYKYRSTHGAAICSKNWLAQFSGYHGQTLKVGKEIQAISGATISAKALTADMERGYRLMQELIIPPAFPSE